MDLNNIWESIDVGWSKVDVGFKIATYISDINSTVAEEYLKKTESFRDEILIDAKATASAYIACIRLALRAFNGLF
jgi:D-tyrosyl-tRNA(Tyr) deacylase